MTRAATGFTAVAAVSRAQLGREELQLFPGCIVPACIDLAQACVGTRYHAAQRLYRAVYCTLA
jgi:hypothetical protein